MPTKRAIVTTWIPGLTSSWLYPQTSMLEVWLLGSRQVARCWIQPHGVPYVPLIDIAVAIFSQKVSVSFSFTVSASVLILPELANVVIWEVLNVPLSANNMTKFS